MVWSLPDHLYILTSIADASVSCTQTGKRTQYLRSFLDSISSRTQSVRSYVSTSGWNARLRKHDNMTKTAINRENCNNRKFYFITLYFQHLTLCSRTRWKFCSMYMQLNSTWKKKVGLWLSNGWCDGTNTKSFMLLIYDSFLFLSFFFFLYLSFSEGFKKESNFSYGFNDMILVPFYGTSVVALSLVSFLLVYWDVER